MNLNPQMDPDTNRRILVIDDNAAIHADFRKILMPASAASADLLAVETELFGEAASAVDEWHFELVMAHQGREGHERAVAAKEADRPFAMAFVDMRMPPGWDGIETIEHLWRDCPELEVVICTAFSDYSWEETIRRLGRSDQLLIVKKPFDHVEIQQMACALTSKWSLHRKSTRLLDQLGNLVKERTAELEQARDELISVNESLVGARDVAEAANRSKTLFLANMSHELRTPMTAILGYAQELEERTDCADSASFDREAVVTIRRNAEHLIGLIGDLLDIAKMDAGKLTVNLVRCDVRELLREVEAILRPKAEEKQLAFDVVCVDPMEAAIRTDPLRLRQILVNLVDNAIKFTMEGGVNVRASMTAAPESMLHVEVIDSGIGIAPEALQRVFLSFEQADASTTRRFGGTGLGLAISQQLAVLLGGGIEVESSPGAGSRFLVTVAAGPPAADDPVEVSNPGQSSAGLLSTTGDRRAHVLLVEDGLDNRRLIAHLLEKAGCSVEFADNGLQCLERMAMAGAAVDLVLMDMQMPVMGGLEATRRLRERGSRVPIVMLTANAMPEAEQLSIDAGCDDFLTKPIERKRLVEVVAQQSQRPD